MFTNSKAMDESTIRHLFSDKMTNLDFKKLSNSGFSLFESYFFFLNEKTNHLKKISPSGTHSSSVPLYYAIEPNPTGMEDLWRIAMDAPDQISRRAIDTLNNLHHVVRFFIRMTVSN